MTQATQFAQQNALTLLLTAAAIFTAFWLWMFRKRLKMNLSAVVLISILHVIYGVFCVKVFAVIEGFGDLSVVGNMSLFGGVFFMPIAYALGAKITRRNAAEVFDIFTICMVFTLMCARVNCIIGGCCTGRAIPWLSGATWPTRQLELLYYVILMAYFIPKIRGERTHGEVYPLYMLSYGIFRFITECFRSSGQVAGIWHLSHVWAFIAFAMGTSIYLEMKGKEKKQRTKIRR